MMIKYLFIILLVFGIKGICNATTTFEDSVELKDASYPGHHKQPSVNIYVISMDKYFDNVSRFIILEAKIASLLHPRKMKVIKVHSTADAAEKIAAIVNKHHCSIDNLWFDSHGKYRKGYSSFMIGTDEYYYKNICDSSHCIGLETIAKFCDRYTNIGLGSCYAGATFNFPTSDSAHKNMHGDSLLKGIANIFKGSFIYGSESWVMAKPGIFGSRNALAGFPLSKEYKDVLFTPVWSRLGMWRRYNPTKSEMESINTVHLSGTSGILIEKHSYHNLKRAQRKMVKNINKLESGRYKMEVQLFKATNLCIMNFFPFS